jgi:hypothetical protein
MDEGLQLVSSCYFYGLLLPVAYLMRKLLGHDATPKSDLQRHNGLVNSLLKGICFIELLFMRANRMAGLTVFCLARIPGNAKTPQAEV